MLSKMKTILIFSLLMTFTTALQFSPQPTVMTATTLKPYDYSPIPTKAPSVEELRKRALTIAATDISGLVIGADNTCGYADGISVESRVFCPGALCALAITPGAIGEMYCCGRGSTASCERRWTTCVDFTDVSSSCPNGVCNTEETLLCPLTIPYCGRGFYKTVDVGALYCDTEPYSKDESWDTTYPGQAGHAFTPVVKLTTTSSSTNPISSFTSSSRTSPTPTPTPPPPGPKTPVGPIVGGAVGGFAVIAAILAGVVLCRRRKPKASTEGESQPPPTFVKHETGGAQEHTYTAPPPEKSASASHTTYVPPTYAEQSSPPQQYANSPQFTPQSFSPAPVSAVTAQYHDHQYGSPQPGHSYPQELTSNPASPRPESSISQSTVPAYVPYQPTVTERHEIQ